MGNLKLIFHPSVFILGLFILTSSNLKKTSRIFRDRGKYDRSKLELFDDGNFYQSKSSCTYGFNAKGTWVQIGDTIYLNRKKVKGSTAYIDRATKIFVKNADSLIYAWDLNFGLSHWMVLSEE